MVGRHRCGSCLVLLSATVTLTLCHVVLRYPSPRSFDLDFLENSTSPEPCGMEKGLAKTVLLSGKPFNVSWKIPYPARTGGYRLQLLDALSRPLLDLTPVTSDSLFVTLDGRTENFTVNIPNDYECENCTIRLIRESDEWTEKRWFWSCADVHVKSKKTYRETCSGRGRYLLSKCRCDRFFYGENCQYREECVDNTDCGEMGRCIDLESPTPPSKQCFCQMGWFGPNCAKRSAVRSPEHDLSGHIHKELAPGFNLYWRLMPEQGEIEMAVVAQTTSYVAVGWRPNITSLNCRNFPQIDNRTVDDSNADNENELHPMECTDMVIAMVRGTASKIWDYYSKDRSTPKTDDYWGGKNDLTAAVGFEKDRVTTVIFRKKIKGEESTDHSIVDEEMHVIWARGQDKTSLSHWFDDAHNDSKSQQFYTDDQLQYHGFEGNRGKTSINFYDDASASDEVVGGNSTDTHTPNRAVGQFCTGEWKHPKGCSIAGDDCEYYAQWLYLPEKDSIRFTVSTNNTDLWTGIAFSNDHKMTQTDAIIGLVDKNGRVFVMDTWIVGKTSPFLDSSQDVTDESGKVTDGRTTITFERKRDTGDNRDLAFTDDQCLYMMYPVKGGKFNAVNKKIRQHKTTPSISSTRICIRACPSDGSGDSSRIGIYGLKVKLAALGKEFRLPKKGSAEYENFSGSITGAFNKLLSRFQKSLSIDFKDFSRQEDYVITSLELRSENRNLDPAIRKTIENAVNKGQVGNIYLEPGYWQYDLLRDSVRGRESEEFHKKILSTILESWIVISCLVALLALVMIQAWCSLCCRTSATSDQKDAMYPNMAWKDYSGSSLNYGADGTDAMEKQPPPEGIKAGGLGGPGSGPIYQKTNYTLQPKGAKHGNADVKPLSRAKGPSERTTQTLPRAPLHDPEPPPPASYYTHRPAKPHNSDKPAVQPDFYFMPSQRKYSGEVVRVYVDYDNQSK